MKTVDGSYMEGGGQIVRTAVALSALTKTSIKIVNIRSNRPNPGLRAQHLSAIEAVKKLSNAMVTGVGIGSTEVEFSPGEIKPKAVEVSIPTAGSIGLVVETIALAAAMQESPIKVVVSGGATFGKWAPPMPYLDNVFFPTLGYPAHVNVIREGFYPKGGAHVVVSLSPEDRRPFESADLGRIKRLHGMSIASEILKKGRVAERQAASASDALQHMKCRIDIVSKYQRTRSPGTGICLFATDGKNVLGQNALGERGRPAEKVGSEAAAHLIDEMKKGSPLDKHMGDQVIPFLALHGGEVCVSAITRHTETNIWLTEQLLDVEFEIDADSGKIVVRKSFG